MGLVTKCDMSAIILPSASGKGQGRVTFEGSGRVQGGCKGGTKGGAMGVPTPPGAHFGG